MNSATSENTAFPAAPCDPDAAEVELVPLPLADAESWRTEVAARLARYRSRRKPRSPRYPSLLLPFEAPESWSKASTSDASAEFSTMATTDSAAMHESCGEEPLSAEFAETPRTQPTRSEMEPVTNLIEFPRSAAIPVFHASTLADPIFDRPRIVEAPEVMPPPPALGGMLIEPVQQEQNDRRLDADLLIAPASLSWRLLAALVDGLILCFALTAFGAIFLRLNPIRGPLPLLLGIAAVAAVLFWMTYQFLFVVYTGSTPGLRAARLRIARFDGAATTRRVRRWRVMATFLSAFSAGLGYLWSFTDQDSLCWHDRITKTHVQSSR